METPKITPRRKIFNDRYGKLTDEETLKELLYMQQLTVDKLESIRKNTYILVLVFVIIPAVAGGLLAIYSLLTFALLALE